MSKFNRVLSSDDVFDLHEKYDGCVFKVIEAAEQTILEKLTEQEPVATLEVNSDSGIDVAYHQFQGLYDGMKLYAHPIPVIEQDPVAYIYDDEVFGVDSGTINDHIRRHGQPLYTNPCVSQDKGYETQIPEGWQLVPTEPTEEMKKSGGHINSEWLNDFAPVGEKRYAIPMEGVYKAMLAAAPKYKEIINE